MTDPIQNLNPEPNPKWFLGHKFLYSILGILILVVIGGSVAWWKIVNQTQLTFEPHYDSKLGCEWVAEDLCLNSTEKGTYTSTWKTYTNSQYGFEIQYPSNLVPLENSGYFYKEANFHSVFKLCFAPINYKILVCNVEMYISPDLEKFKLYSHNLLGWPTIESGGKSIDVMIPNEQKALIGNISAREVNFPPLEVGGPILHNRFFVKGNYAYLFTVQRLTVQSLISDQEAGKELPIYDTMLSTFKFTEPTSSVDVSNWKTYTNGQYGFEFKYPDNFIAGKYRDEPLPNPENSIKAFQQAGYSAEEINEKIHPFKNNIVLLEKDIVARVLLEKPPNNHGLDLQAIPVGEGFGITVKPSTGKNAKFLVDVLSLSSGPVQQKINSFTVIKSPGAPYPYGYGQFYYLLQASDNLVIEFTGFKKYPKGREFEKPEADTGYDQVIDQILSTFKFMK